MCVPTNTPPKQRVIRSPWGIMGLEQGSEDRTKLFPISSAVRTRLPPAAATQKMPVAPRTTQMLPNAPKCFQKPQMLLEVRA